MRFKELEESDIKYFTEVYYHKDITWDNRLRILSERFECSTRTLERWASILKLTTTTQEESPQYQIAQEREYNKKSKRFIISWAQNNTGVNTAFIENMKAYADFINADIHIIAGRYKNPTSVWTNNQEESEFWDPIVVPYLDANRHNIHKYLSIMSDVKVQPTAVNPMTGLEGMSGINSCIVGSPKMQMELVPVLEGNAPKMMSTTGACTNKNYTDSKAGKKGEFHHTLGFVIVEIKNDEIFFMRQVTATESGSFTDLFYNTTDCEVSRISEISAIILGDLHYGKHDQDVLNKTLDFMNILHPEHVILHDVFDGTSLKPFLNMQY